MRFDAVFAATKEAITAYVQLAIHESGTLARPIIATDAELESHVMNSICKQDYIWYDPPRQAAGPGFWVLQTSARGVLVRARESTYLPISSPCVIDQAMERRIGG